MDKNNTPLKALKEGGKPKGKLAQNTTVMIGDKPTVLYMASDKGPFECQHCEYFHAPSSCELVNGTIDPKGCCSLYEPKGKS